jgi:ribosomal 50S subunit-associated protein YjgA (DUF615 family)
MRSLRLAPWKKPSARSRWPAPNPKRSRSKKAPFVAELARLDRELTNLTASLASGGAGLDTVLNAIRERESARKSAAARVEELDSLEREARAFDASAKADELRAVLNDWTAMLEKYPETGRQVLRQIIRGPLRVTHEADGGWTIAGVGTFGGIVRRVYGLQVPESEIEELNAYAEFLNAEAEAMARPLFDGAGLPVDGGTPEKSGIPAVQQETCPRGDSNTRHAV